MYTCNSLFLFLFVIIRFFGISVYRMTQHDTNYMLNRNLVDLDFLLINSLCQSARRASAEPVMMSKLCSCKRFIQQVQQWRFSPWLSHLSSIIGFVNAANLHQLLSIDLMIDSYSSFGSVFSVTTSANEVLACWSAELNRLEKKEELSEMG